MRQTEPPFVRIARAAVKQGFAIVFLVATTSCDTPGIRLVNPDTPDRPTDVIFQVTLEDATLAEALGWERGVPEATVYLQRVGEPFEPDTLITDSLGQAHLPDILPGQFKVAAYRVLDEAETGPTDGVVRAFGDGWIRDVYRGDTVSMTLVADNPGSLVFSEWYAETVPGYSYAKYVELYNNSDTTIFLDGMLVGNMWSAVGEIPDLSCAESESWRNDPLGVWSKGMHQFPGNGSDYSVAPGQTVVIARDAVDHSVVDPKLPDLSRADFELEGAADSDNPDVPNMPYLGPASEFSGHGIDISPLFIAQATEFESLTLRRDFRGNEKARVPTERLLDVVRIVDPYYHRVQLQIPPCGISVPRSVERLEGGEYHLFEFSRDLMLANHRVILRASASGMPVLQDVNTSFVDFVVATRNPGWVEW